MQDFTPGQGESSHDHFLATFGKFGAVSGLHPGRLLAQVTTSAAKQNQFYPETMLTPAYSAVAGCALPVRFISQVSRGGPREVVFAGRGVDIRHEDD